MTPNQPGGGDGEKRACFRIEIWFANYRGRTSPGNVRQSPKVLPEARGRARCCV